MSEKLALSLHLLLCKREHNDTPEGCPWYTEEQLAECWEKEAHSIWLEKATKITEIVETNNEEMWDLISRIYKMVGELIYLKEKFRGLESLIDTLVIEGSKLKLPKSP